MSFGTLIVWRIESFPLWLMLRMFLTIGVDTPTIMFALLIGLYLRQSYIKRTNNMLFNCLICCFFRRFESSGSPASHSGALEKTPRANGEQEAPEWGPDLLLSGPTAESLYLRTL